MDSCGFSPGAAIDFYQDLRGNQGGMIKARAPRGLFRER
jgi:hypothetical protein